MYDSALPTCALTCAHLMYQFSERAITFLISYDETWFFRYCGGSETLLRVIKQFYLLCKYFV